MLRNLSTGSAVQVDNDIKSIVTSPATDLVKVCQTSLWEVFTVRIYNTLVNPVPDWNANCIETIA